MKHIEENEDGQLVFKCPVCGDVVSDGEGEVNPCQHVVMIYSDCCGGFTHVDKWMEKLQKKIEKAWAEEMESPFELMEKFADASKGQYEIYEATLSGMACGPVSFTDYYMVEVGKKKSKKSKK